MSGVGVDRKKVGRRNNVTVTGRADGPVVTLAHGFGCDQNMWRLVVPGLVKDFRVHCPRLSAPDATLAAIVSFAADSQ